MRLVRSTFLSLAAATIAAPVTSRFAAAQEYPTPPVRLIVPFPTRRRSAGHASHQPVANSGQLRFQNKDPKQVSR